VPAYGQVAGGADLDLTSKVAKAVLVEWPGLGPQKGRCHLHVEDLQRLGPQVGQGNVVTRNTFREQGQRCRLHADLGHHRGGDLQSLFAELIAVSVQNRQLPGVRPGGLADGLHFQGYGAVLAGGDLALLEARFQTTASRPRFHQLHIVLPGVDEGKLASKGQAAANLTEPQ